MKSKFILLVIFGTILFAPVITAAQKKPSAEEQRLFSAEDDSVQHPIELPDGVIEILKQDQLVKNSLEYENLPANQLPAFWFSVSEIHLAGPDEMDLVVEAQGLLRGANTIRFWVVRPNSHGFEMLLMTAAHDLLVRNRRSGGYKEIEAIAVIQQKVVTVRYRFDGTQYRAVGDKTKN